MVRTKDIWGCLDPFRVRVREDVGLLVDIWYDLSWPAMVENVLVTFDDFPLTAVIHMNAEYNNNAEVTH